MEPSKQRQAARRRDECDARQTFHCKVLTCTDTPVANRKLGRIDVFTSLGCLVFFLIAVTVISVIVGNIVSSVRDKIENRKRFHAICEIVSKYQAKPHIELPYRALTYKKQKVIDSISVVSG